MTHQELLMLAFFSKDLPQKMTSKDLTSEMTESGITDIGNSSFHYLVHQLKSKDLLIEYKDPLKIQEGSIRAFGSDLLILSDKAIEILDRQKRKKEYEAYVTELEFKKLRSEYDLLSSQLFDYDKTRTQASNSYRISCWALFVAIISAAIAFMQTIGR